MKVTDKRVNVESVAPAAPVPLLIAGATEAAIVRPGDTLLLIFEHPLSGERMQALQWGLAQHHPDLQVIVIDGAKASVITQQPEGS